MKGGYFMLPRGLLRNPAFKPKGAYTNAEAWLWMYEAAAFKPRDITVTNGRKTETIRLERGQLSYSVRYLAEAWGWSKAKVQRFLDETQNGTLTETHNETHQTVITICNYGVSDAVETDSETQNETQSDTQNETNKKEGRRTKVVRTKAPAAPRGARDSSEQGFSDWYSVYPRRTQRAAALKAYRKIIAGGTISHDELMERTRRFAALWTRRLADKPGDKQFIPYPASWLNKGGYDDRPEDEPGSPGRPLPIAPSPAKVVADFGDEDWRRNLDFYRRKQMWSAEWGPEPGKPNCLVPAHLLLSPVTSVGAA